MDNSAHKRALSIVHIVTGSLTLVIFLFINIIIRTIFPFLEEEIYQNEGSRGMLIFELVTQSAKAIMTIIILLIPVPSIIGGIALLNNRKWGLVLLMISGCLSLFSFPVGTTVGVYTIWVYVQDSKESNVEN